MAKYRVTANVLRIRSGPGLSYSILGALLRDTLVQGDEVNGEWIHVTSPDNKVGWCHSDFLEGIDETQPAPTQEAYRVETTLNLRLGPGLSYTVIGSLMKNEIVAGLATSPDGGWAQVRRRSGAMGWASMQYLTKIESPPSGPGDSLMIVTTSTLNVRAGPGMGYSIIGKVQAGETLTYLNADPDWNWVQIKTGRELIGWCSSRYLSEKPDLFASAEDYPAMGLHRVLADSIFMRAGPGDMYEATIELKFNAVVSVDLISPNGKWKHCMNAWGDSGWYPIERLARLGEAADQKNPEEFPYLPIAYAELGIREVPGSASNPRIQEYIQSTDLASYPSLPDETDWCACFINWCIGKAGLPSTNSAIVSPWMSWGIKPDSLRRGCVITFRWDDGWQHVSFYLGELGQYVICLGGNQSNAVWISIYHKKHITSYRAPV